MNDTELLIQYLLTKRKLKQLSKYNDSCFSLVQRFLEYYLQIYCDAIIRRNSNSKNIKIHNYANEIFNDRKRLQTNS